MALALLAWAPCSPQAAGDPTTQPRVQLSHIFGSTSTTVLYAEPGGAAHRIGLTDLPKLSKLYIAGLYNSGTNFAFDTFRRNCGEGGPGWQATYRPDPNLISEQQQATLHELGGLEDEGRVCSTNHASNASYLCYGKHTDLSAFRARFPRYITSADCEDCAVLVVVRHPLWFAQSTCRHEQRYDCTFSTADEDCPQVASAAVSCANGANEGQRITSNYDSLAHLWHKWHGAYASAGVSQNRRIFIRYEDLLFRTSEVVHAICRKMGLQAPKPANVTLEPDSINPAEAGEAFERADPEEMLMSYAEEDLARAERAIPAELLSRLDYTLRLPESRRASLTSQAATPSGLKAASTNAAPGRQQGVVQPS